MVRRRRNKKKNSKDISEEFGLVWSLHNVSQKSAAAETGSIQNKNKPKRKKQLVLREFSRII